MAVSANARPDALLSVHAAATWLKSHGVRPNTRHTIYAAIAQQRLAVAAVAERVVLIRRTDLERYAEQLLGNDKAATSA